MGISPTRSIGEVQVYGEWDDVIDNQFLLIWHEAGPYCTVILLSGTDYGGGVTHGSSDVPIKIAADIINNAENAFVAKELFSELVSNSLEVK